jgi:hypothetical protein
MKKVTLLLVVGLLALGATSAWAQGGRIVISPTVGYRTSGDFGFRPTTDVVTEYSGIKFSDAMNYGLSLGFRLSPYVTMEAGWTRAITGAEAISYYVGQPNLEIGDVSEDVIHANFLFYFGENELVKPFFVTGLGVTLVDAREAEVDSVSRFSWNLGMGFDKMFNEKMGIRVTAKWFTTYINDQMGWWYDWWWGGYYLVPVSQYMGQWEFTGGLIFRF